ncbi:hypothetical protein T02_7600 [Trichinella nativa]|uniref:Uncharacterized protein n=1 Tax=Trichinella nativa TaxID=6335 RepID=A0A0V1LQK6_9BILA|nr:hypothetical protein T02_7600 [Trichinella nativa]
MIEWHSCGSFRVIDEPKTLALFAQQQKHHPHHIITISSFTVHDYVVHASFIRGLFFYFEIFARKRRLNEVQALYTVKHFCSCSDLLQSQFLLTKSATAYCLLLTAAAAADAFAASTFAATAAFAGAAHQKKKLKNKLDHFITIKCFTMSKKWEYHVVEMPFCCCISEVITIDIGAQLQTTIKLDEHYKLDMLQNCRLLLDLVLLLLCCFLYELNLFNDLLNLI